MIQFNNHRTTASHAAGLAEASRQLDAKIAPKQTVTQVAHRIAEKQRIEKQTAATEQSIKNVSGFSANAVVQNSYFGNVK